jgi:hypothetical protein
MESYLFKVVANTGYFFHGGVYPEAEHTHDAARRLFKRLQRGTIQQIKVKQKVSS